MISKGTTHNDGAKLARYMTQGKEGERAQLWDIRGFASNDITEAFRSVHVMAEATKCKQPFFHVQVRNPEGETLTREQWLIVANRHERMLGLTGQPRAISFHTDEKTGHEHMHIAWSRIDEETMTAKPLPFFKKRLKQTSRELELHFNLTRVRNERPGPIKYAPTRAQEEQARRLGVDIHEVRNTIRECWDRSDCGRSFETALAHEGLMLTLGDRRGFVVIDHAGGLHALSKRILDVPAAQIRDRLSDLDLNRLPGVEEARDFIRDLSRDPQQQKADALDRLKRERAEIDRLLYGPSLDDLKRELAEVDKLIADAARKRAQEKPAPVCDRDRYNDAWHDAVIKAAIEKEKTEPKPPQTRAGSREKEPQQEERKPVAPQLGKTQGQIRLARSLSHGPQSFANALEDRSFILARVTSDDIKREMEQLRKEWEQRRRNPQTWMEHEGGFAALTPELQDSARRSYDEWNEERDNEKEEQFTLEDYVDFVQEKWREGPKSQLERATGGLAVITPFGSVYTLTPRNTGLNRDELPEYLKGIDRAVLLSVTDAQAVVKEVQQQRRIERHWPEWEKHWPVMPPPPEPIKTSPRYHFEDAARDTTHPEPPPIMPEKLKGSAAHIWTAYHHSDNARAFAAALGEHEMSLAAATKEEANRSHRQAAFARAVGNFAAEYREGEIVAVTGRGQVYQLNHRTTGEDPARIEKFMKPLDRKLLQGIEATKETLKARAEQRNIEVQAFRDMLRDTNNARHMKRAQQPGREAPVWGAKGKVSRVIKRVASKAPAPTLGGLLGGAGKIVQSLFDLIDPPLTPELKRQHVYFARKREADAADSKHELEFSQQLAALRQKEQERPPERENDRKDRDRER